MKGRKWTQEDIEYLEGHYDKSNWSTLCKKLNRSRTAIMMKAQRLKIRNRYKQNGWISVNCLSLAITGHRQHAQQYRDTWSKLGLPVHVRRRGQSKITFVDIDEFWAWAERYRCKIGFANMEPGILGIEPEWVKEQRRMDQREMIAVRRNAAWTAYEDERLRYLVSRYQYGYAEIARELKRSEGSIFRRCITLKLQGRPVRRDAHTPWTQEEKDHVKRGLIDGLSYWEIAKALPRHSEKSVRGWVGRAYGTEKRDKARQAILEALLV